MTSQMLLQLGHGRLELLFFSFQRRILLSDLLRALDFEPLNFGLQVLKFLFPPRELTLRNVFR